MDHSENSVKFTKINHFIAIAAFGTWMGEDLQINSTSLCITYSDYVKSQIYDNLVTHLFGRDATQYFNAGKFLEGYDNFLADARQVLQYFYEDMLTFLCNNGNDVSIQLKVDVDLKLPEKTFSISKSKEALMALLVEEDESKLMEQLKHEPMAVVVDEVLNRTDALNKINSYTLAGIIKQAISPNLVALKLEG